MNILKENPPIIDRIKAVFPLNGKEIFAWGDVIYNPSGSHISPELMAHEEVHSRQQRSIDIDAYWLDPLPTLEDKILAWWDRYLIDSEFRLNQELEAHRTEYKTFCKNHKDRNLRAKYLHAIASRLASPMYGSMLTTREASIKISL